MKLSAAHLKISRMVAIFKVGKLFFSHDFQKDLDLGHWQPLTPQILPLQALQVVI